MGVLEYLMGVFCYLLGVLVYLAVAINPYLPGVGRKHCVMGQGAAEPSRARPSRDRAEPAQDESGRAVQTQTAKPGRARQGPDGPCQASWSGAGSIRAEPGSAPSFH